MIHLMQQRDCDEVSRLHLKYLPTSFQGIPGRRLLNLYYANVVDGDGSVGYVAMEGERVVGYICGIWDVTALHYSLIRKHWVGLMWWGLAQGLFYPRLAGAFLRRIGSLVYQQWRMKAAQAIQPEYELRPVVVADFARRRGLAMALTEKIIQDASRRGYPCLHLYTEIDNFAAQRLYHKLGFCLLGQVIRHGAPYYHFERRLITQIWTPVSLPSGSVAGGTM